MKQVSINSRGLRAETMRARNRKLIFDLVVLQEPISRSVIAQALDLSFTAVSDILGDLININLIQEISPYPSLGGRPPRLIEVRTDAVCLLGLSFNTTETRALLTDPRAGILGEAVITMEPELMPEMVMSNLVEAGKQVLSQFQGDHTLYAYGVACSAPVSRDGKVRLLGTHGWIDSELEMTEYLSCEFGVPGVIDNDANLGALAEMRLDDSRNLQNLIYISIAGGVGAGIVSDGKIFRGDMNWAGELGHIVIDSDGASCSCGSYGCLESYVSARHLVEYAIKAAKFGHPTSLHPLDINLLDPDEVIDSALKGDAAAIYAFEQLGKWLSLGVVSLVHLFNPEVIIIGGPLARAGRILLDPLELIALRRLLPDFRSQVKFRTSNLGKNGPALGAVIYALDTLLEHENFKGIKVQEKDLWTSVR